MHMSTAAKANPKPCESFGDRKGDLMIFERAQSNAHIALLVERKTHFAVLLRNSDRSATHLMNRLMGVMAPLPLPARRSITFDKGGRVPQLAQAEAGDRHRGLDL